MAFPLSHPVPTENPIRAKTLSHLLYRMKRPRHGSLWLSLTPEELLAKLATLVPPPRVQGLRYHGAFAP